MLKEGDMMQAKDSWVEVACTFHARRLEGRIET